MKFVIILVIIVLIEAEFSAAIKLTYKCVPNVPYKENNCNRCVCSTSGELGCTQKFCGGNEHRELIECSVGTVNLKKCNVCTCVEDMGTVCSTYDC